VLVFLASHDKLGVVVEQATWHYTEYVPRFSRVVAIDASMALLVR
jgi:hypothetical protein